MDIQGITTSQILTVGIFLAGLIFLQIFITKNKNKFSYRWNNNNRIRIIEEKALSSTEKIRIISVDSNEYLIVSNKGKKSSLITIGNISNNTKKRSLPVLTGNKNKKSELNLNLTNTKISGAENQKKNTEHELSKAIKVARQMNPNVSYKWWKFY